MSNNTAKYQYQKREDDIRELGERVHLTLNSQNLIRWNGQHRKANQNRRIAAVRRLAFLAQLKAQEKKWEEREGGQ